MRKDQLPDFILTTKNLNKEFSKLITCWKSMVTL